MHLQRDSETTREMKAPGLTPSTAMLENGRGVGPFAVSVALHAALLVGILAPQLSHTPVPKGYWVELATPAPARPVPPMKKAPVAPTASKTDLSTDAKQAATAPAAAPSVAQNRPLGRADGVEASTRQRYLFELEVFLNQNKTYPSRARHLGLSGEVEVAFHLHKDGSISDPHLVRPCIHDVLNQAAVEHVSRVGHFRPIPQELNVDVWHITVPIAYELN